MDLENLHTGVPGRDGDLDDPVEAAWPEQGIVKDVHAVGGCDDLDITDGVEAIQLRQELHKGPLDLPVPGSGYLEALGADGVDLVDEDDGWGFLAGHVKQLADDAGALADVLLHQLGAHDVDEGGIGDSGHSLGQQCLASTWRSDEQDATRGLDAHLAEELWLGQRELHRLLHLQDLGLEAADVIIGDVGLLQHLGVGHQGVLGAWQDRYDGEGLLVEGHAGPYLQLFLLDEVGREYDEVRARGGPDDDPAVLQEVLDGADDEGRCLEAVQLDPQTLYLLLQADELALDEAALALGTPELLEELCVACL